MIIAVPINIVNHELVLVRVVVIDQRRNAAHGSETVHGKEIGTALGDGVVDRQDNADGLIGLREGLRDADLKFVDPNGAWEMPETRGLHT